MATKKTAESVKNSSGTATEKNEVVKLNEQQLANFNENLFDMFAEKDDHELNELTSNLLKMDAGDVFNGVMSREVSYLKNEDGEDYECATLYDKDKSKHLIADAVAVSTIKRYFESRPDVDFAPIRIVCKGMRKSSSDSKREYRDLKIMTI